MFNNSANIVINGGTFVQNNTSLFSNIRRRPRGNDSHATDGLEILHKYIAHGASYDSIERVNAPACHPGTRIGILSDIRGWVNDKKRKTTVLWIHGPAGSGKTAICQTLATQCDEDGDLTATFFFEAGSASRGNARPLITTIAYQVANNIESARGHISNAVLKNPQQIFEKTLHVQMRDLIIKPLQQAADASTAIPRSKLVLIDGLDECRPSESQEEILRAIHYAVTRNRFPLCIIISSRREPQLRDAFEGYLKDVTQTIALDGALNPDHDVKTYLRSSFADISHRHRYNPIFNPLTSKWPSESTVQTIVTKASGQFIYATTVVRFVDVRHENPTERLETALRLSNYREGDSADMGNNAFPFSELDRLYQKIFEEVHDIQLTLRILGCIILLRAPINLEDLEILLELKPGMVELSLDKLHSVLEIFNVGQDRFIHFHHESLKEFLFNPIRSGTYHIKTKAIHHELSRRLSPYSSGVQYSLAPYSIIIPFFHSTSAQSYHARHSPVDPLNSATLTEWVYHMSMLDSDFLDPELFAIRGTGVYRVTKVAKKFTEKYICYTDRSSELNDIIDQFSTLVNNFKNCPGNENSNIVKAYTTALDLHFQCHLSASEMSSETRLTTLAILAMFMQGNLSTPAAAFGLLLHLDWSGFVGATLPLRNFMSFRPSIKFLSRAFSEFIADPDRSKDFNPMTDTIHADLTIYCLEFIKKFRFFINSGTQFLSNESQSYPDSDGMKKALEYAEANWREHMTRGNGQRLLSYVYFVADHDGYPPMPCKIHNQRQCNNFCKVMRLSRCIERAQMLVNLQVVESPKMSLMAFALAEYLGFMKEIITIKTNTPHFSSLKSMEKSYYVAMPEVPKEFLLAERSNVLKRNNLSKFPFPIQGVLWASRKNYSGQWPT